MAAPPSAEAPYKKDIVHNLGYNPIVRAYTYLDSYSITGWVRIPISYYERVWDEGMGWIIENRVITYEYVDSNTVRFYGDSGTQLEVDLFIEPRKDAWYG